MDISGVIFTPIWKHCHHLNTWQLPACPRTWTTHEPVLSYLHQRAYSTQRGVYSVQLMWLCLYKKWNMTHRPTPIWLLWGRKSGREEKPNPGCPFLFQHEHVLLVFSSNWSDHSDHPQHCLFNEKLSGAVTCIVLVWLIGSEIKQWLWGFNFNLFLQLTYVVIVAIFIHVLLFFQYTHSDW